MFEGEAKKGKIGKERDIEVLTKKGEQQEIRWNGDSEERGEAGTRKANKEKRRKQGKESGETSEEKAKEKEEE